ncbi:hypothetical protein OPV22_006671 [Ensete ventricosum]|uniref:Uncharacterized protein n=1 Tax=Ensete ventricosum TaxID=4639 RepID=A0AAV8RTN4_ENSVE|nr:hypothetical protein OPV22_006671 [Ensete ventricosum]
MQEAAAKKNLMSTSRTHFFSGDVVMASIMAALLSLMKLLVLFCCSHIARLLHPKVDSSGLGQSIKGRQDRRRWRMPLSREDWLSWSACNLLCIGRISDILSSNTPKKHFMISSLFHDGRRLEVTIACMTETHNLSNTCSTQVEPVQHHLTVSMQLRCCAIRIVHHTPLRDMRLTGFDD